MGKRLIVSKQQIAELPGLITIRVVMFADFDLTIMPETKDVTPTTTLYSMAQNQINARIFYNHLSKKYFGTLIQLRLIRNVTSQNIHFQVRVFSLTYST